MAKRTRKSTQVLNLRWHLRFVWPPTCVDLHRLSTTCVDFDRAQIWTQVHASFLPFGHPAQVDTYKPMIRVKFTDFCDLRADLRIRLAIGSQVKFVGNFWFANLRWLASTCESQLAEVARYIRTILKYHLDGFTQSPASSTTEQWRARWSSDSATRSVYREIGKEDRNVVNVNIKGRTSSRSQNFRKLTTQTNSISILRRSVKDPNSNPKATSVALFSPIGIKQSLRCSN